MNDTPTPKNEQPTYAMLVNEMLAKMSDRALIAEYQLATVTEQRDEYKMAFQLAENHNHKMATELEIVTEQRDRLAKALERLEKTARLPAWWDDPARVQARQALQSLTSIT